ncbi:MAG: SPFH/Band 7/PHB domain protein [Rickettsia sp.]|nr:SPFH/Band 7/PHB domain protein [Rickettsia sp.]
MIYILFSSAVFLCFIIFSAVKIVPQQEAWVVEKLGKLDKTLSPGLNILIPVIQKIAYKHSLKETSLEVHKQTAISKDNVSLNIDGILYFKIIDPVAASYGVSNPYFAVSQLAQTNMRSEIGKLTLDKTFEERENLNYLIVNSINAAAINWGIQCMRYEIKDIYPPESILKAMELQVEADRKKRAQILNSEGARQSSINKAEGEKRSIILNSEASYQDQVNRAKGEAEAVLLLAKASAQSIDIISQALQKTGGMEAVSAKIAEQYVQAFSNLAKESNTLILSSEVNNPSNMIAQALSIFKNLNNSKEKINN